MKKMKSKISSKKGFTLVELAVVLIVVGFLFFGATRMFSYISEKAKIDATNNTLDAIEKALRLYQNQQTNADLPCPAIGSLALDASAYGVEDCASVASNNVMRGVVPTRTLKLPDSYMFDGWGNRISYFVSNFCAFSGASTWTVTCAPQATMARVYDNTTGAAPADERTPKAAYVLVSHGKNGVGAWRRNGGANRVPSVAATTTAEMENAHVNTTGGDATGGNIPNGTFRDDFIRDWKGTEGVTGDGTYFDDLVRWKIPAQITYTK